IDLAAPNRRALAYMAKVSAGETAFEVARQAVELHGGQGVMRDDGIERYLRDASLFFHIDGTNDIHRFRVIKELFPDTAGQYAGPEPAGAAPFDGM
ncbi:MAG: acyl-CoA dehydrogenase family protein, partial [Acidimicrobiia bacterium]|nr:acyl-CoA dehydrogenase family protein [Acidimicrobiia bacterium]